MVARRLLVILLVLLGVSTLAAALAPPRDDGGDETTTTEPAKPPPVVAQDEPAGGALYKIKIDADSEFVEIHGDTDPPFVVGDQVVVEVFSKRSDEVEIPDLGQIEAVSRDAPATFDLLFEQPGTFPVRLVGANELIAQIKVFSEAQQE